MKDIEVEYFPFWRRYMGLFREGRLDKLAIGSLVVAMMEYQFEGKEPEELSAVEQVYWLFIRKDLDHAREKYVSSVNNGKKGGRKKTKKEPEETQHNLTEGKTITESISESITESESISISKKDNDIVPLEQGSLCVETKTYGEYGWIVLTDDQYRGLEQEMGFDELQKCIQYIDQAAQSNNNRNHWSDWHLILRRCYQKDWHKAGSYGRLEKDIPKGASGHLGEAELEAIRRVLQS